MAERLKGPLAVGLCLIVIAVAESPCPEVLVVLGHRGQAVRVEGRDTPPVLGGELQRVCIARAVASIPRFVLADEPTGQLDHATSLQVLDALWAAKRPETALVIATHDPMAARYCDRVIRLIDGRIVDTHQ